MTSAVHIAASSISGTGVFAIRNLAAGELLLAIDDTWHVDPEHPPPAGEEHHCDFLAGGRIIWMQTPERYINHSCDPNVFIRSNSVGLREVIARRPISHAEEITFDYSINGSGDTTWTCTCHAERCRHSIHSNFFHLPLALQREYLPLLDTWFRLEYADRLYALAEGEAP